MWSFRDGNIFGGVGEGSSFCDLEIQVFQEKVCYLTF